MLSKEQELDFSCCQNVNKLLLVFVNLQEKTVGKTQTHAEGKKVSEKFSSVVWRQSARSAPQSCMLVVAGNLLEAESAVKVEEREKYLAEKCPPLELPYSRDELMVSPDQRPSDKVRHEQKLLRNRGGHAQTDLCACQELCKQLHEQIGVSEEERYSIEFKLNMVLNEVRHVLRS